MLNHSASNYAVQCNTKRFKQIYFHWYNRMSMNIIVYKRFSVYNSLSKKNVRAKIMCMIVFVYRQKIWKDKNGIICGICYLAGVWSGPPTAADVVTTTPTAFAG